MASEISARAEIDPRAKIGENCKIFPFAYIEGDVEIGILSGFGTGCCSQSGI